MPRCRGGSLVCWKPLPFSLSPSSSRLWTLRRRHSSFVPVVLAHILDASKSNGLNIIHKSFIHSSWSIYLVPDTVLGVGDSKMNKPGFLPWGNHSLMKKIDEENQLFQCSVTLLCSGSALARDAPCEREEIRVESQAVIPKHRSFMGDTNTLIKTMSLWNIYIYSNWFDPHNSYARQNWFLSSPILSSKRLLNAHHVPGTVRGSEESSEQPGCPCILPSRGRPGYPHLWVTRDQRAPRWGSSYISSSVLLAFPLYLDH